jgi:hypothetical protein
MTGEIRTLQSYAALWAALRDMRIEEPGAEKGFEQALALETGWTLDRARLVSAEYRRFLFLAFTAGGEVTPSVDIDKAWHLHLTYTRHYWEVLCGEILRRPLHHVPGTGSEAEEERYRRQYEETLALYEATFDAPPPPSVWPRPEGSEPEPEPAAAPQSQRLPALAAAGVLVMVGSFMAGIVGFGVTVMVAVVCLMVVFSPELGFAGAAVPKKKKGDGGSCGGGCTAGSSGHCASSGHCGGGCGGGCGGS